MPIIAYTGADPRSVPDNTPGLKRVIRKTRDISADLERILISLESLGCHKSL